MSISKIVLATLKPLSPSTVTNDNLTESHSSCICAEISIVIKLFSR